MPAKPSQRWERLRKAGVRSEYEIADGRLVAPVRLEASQGYEYWLGFENLHVITSYNRSNLYAMAIFQLSQAIKEERKRAGARR